MAIQIVVAQTKEDRERIYRFRYQIYVEEMQRTQRYVDLVDKRVVDPMDETGHHFMALDNRELIGVSRNNSAAGNIGNYYDFYQIDLFSMMMPLTRLSILGRFMVRKDYRGTPVGLRFANANVQYGLEMHRAFSLIDCKTEHKPYFEKMGFRQHLPDTHDYRYGCMHRMILCMHDLEYHHQKRTAVLRSIEGITPDPKAMRFWNTWILPMIQHVEKSSKPPVPDSL